MPLPDDYDLWCELHPCPTCGGDGFFPEASGGERRCGYGDGSGIDPEAVDDETAGGA